MNLKPEQKRTWVEVDLDAVEHNYSVIKKTVGGSKKICCVIKANAYGHGAVEIAKTYEKLGADFLAVSNVEEALQLREADVTLPILILGYTDPACAAELVEKNISQCIFSLTYAKSISEAATLAGVKIKAHFKLDTGMGRIGFLPSEREELLNACRLNGLEAEGIFTHFSVADEGEEGEEYTKKQFDVLQETISFLEKNGICFSVKHCANSAATFEYPKTRLDMVRAGIVLYGVSPSEKVEGKGLVPTLKLKTVISHIKTVKKGDCISYGRRYTASAERKIATLPIGYADGLWRSNSEAGGEVEIGGKRVPFVGRICMDQCMVDVTEIDEVKIGDEVTVYGGEISVEEVASRNKTIGYEILCAIGVRVPRSYKKAGKIVKVVDNII